MLQAGQTEPTEVSHPAADTPGDGIAGTSAVEENFERIRRHLQALIDAEPECVKVVAPDGALLDMNAAGLAMVEVDSVEAVRGLSVFDLIVPEHRASFQAMHE